MREVSILDLDKEGSINLDQDSDDNTISAANLRSDLEKGVNQSSSTKLLNKAADSEDEFERLSPN